MIFCSNPEGKPRSFLASSSQNWGDSAFTSDDYVYALTSTNGIDYVGVAALVDKDGTDSVPGASKDTMYGYLTSDAYAGKMDGEDGDKATYEVWTSEGAKTLYADSKFCRFRSCRRRCDFL